VWHDYDFKGLLDKVLGDLPIDRRVFYFARVKEHADSLEKSKELIEEQRSRTRCYRTGMTEVPTDAIPIHTLFRISVYVKGIHALLEIVGGIVLFAMYPVYHLVPGVVAFLTEQELSEDPHDLIANFLIHTANSFSISTALFASFYLLSHGIIKIILVYALLKGKRWAYPWSIAVLGLFIAYQLYRYTVTQSPWLIALSLFDLAVMYLIWREYRSVMSKLQGSESNDIGSRY
jgi:uncharacterized membrane protein